MEKILRIGIDVDNGDLVDGIPPTSKIIRAASRVMEENNQVNLVLSGDKQRIEEAFNGRVPESVSILPSAEYCHSNREIKQAIKGSSLNNLVRETKAEKIGGFFTIGDTSKVGIEGMRLGRHKKVEKPVLVTPIPSFPIGSFLLGDVGATSSNQNVDIFADIENPETFDEEHLKNRKPYLIAIDELSRDLYCQGIMLSVFAQQNGIKVPRLGIVTVGEENHKGSDTVLRTDYLFKQQAGKLENFIEYIGKIEPKDALLERRVDVAISDGHTGNLLLKLSEAIVNLIKGVCIDAKKELSWIEKALCLPAGAILKNKLWEIRATFDPDYYNSAILLGYSGIIGKGHGNSSEDAIYYGIKRTLDCISQGVSPKLDKALETYMPEKPKYKIPRYKSDK
ncbi:MAG: hypothetical protein ABH840_00040 [Nanoarchaeota archaeon]